MKYGIGYKGSKSRIADKILELLPDGERFCDLFGGGFAMSHAAALSGKYKSVLYNDIEPALVHLIKDAVDGLYSPETFNPVWVSRQDFFEKKDYDGYIRYIWSFGNNGKDYLFGKENEKTKEIAFKAITAETIHDRRKYFVKLCGIVTDAIDSKIESLERLERLQSLERLERLEFSCVDYRHCEHRDGDIVYCDIPYETSISGNTYEKHFDFSAFYQWAKTRDYPVYFSSYEISEPGFYRKLVCEKTSAYSAQNNSLKRNEFLYCNFPFDDGQTNLFDGVNK